MRLSRYIYLAILILVFSWPILVQETESPWYFWAYSMSIWFGVIAYAFISERNDV